MSDKTTKDQALGRACNWSIALVACGVLFGLSIAYDGAVWMIVWLLCFPLFGWLVSRQFKALELLADGPFLEDS